MAKPKKNMYAARQEKAAAVAKMGAATGGVNPPNVNEPATAGQPAVMQFNIDQLFGVLGAKEFENTMLRNEISRLNQVVTTYQNIVRELETKVEKKSEE